jgi:hypothetical protein
MTGRYSRPVVLLIACLGFALLEGCTSIGSNPLTLLADPGKYQFTGCEQLAKQPQAMVQP